MEFEKGHIKRRKKSSTEGNLRSSVKIHSRYRTKSSGLTLKLALEPYLGEYSPRNVRVFFSRKGYMEYIELMRQSLKEHNFKKYNFVPKSQQLAFFYPPHVAQAPPTSPIVKRPVAPFHQMVYKSDAMEVAAPPMLVSSFMRLPKYKQTELAKNLIPQIVNPETLYIEYVPFLEDEPKQLKSAGEWIDREIRDEKKAVVLINFADHLAQHPYGSGKRRRSKLDHMLSYFRQLVPERFLDFQQFLLRMGVVPKINKLMSQEGVYLLRKNGYLTDVVHILVYNDAEDLTFSTDGDLGSTEPTGDLPEGHRGLQHGHIQILEEDMYFYTLMHKHTHVPYGHYIVFSRDGDARVVKNPPGGSGKLVEVKDRPMGRSMTVFLYKKRVFPTEYHPFYIVDPSRGLVGMVRMSGRRIINLYL